jgi:peptidyl-prolyl cis-trans isomerase A (cyclophilin A)
MRRQLMKQLLGLVGLSLSLITPLSFAQSTPQNTPTKAIIKTSLGNITLELNAEKAPKSVENFVQYAQDGHYNGTVFHRVIDGFMIQGGGFTKNMQQKPTRAPIAIESRNGLKNLRGTIAMARTMDPNSATSQFFINVVDNNNLDYPSFDGHGYTVFGKVTQGMEVVDKIRQVRTGNVGPHQNVPLTPVVIESVSIQAAK